MLYTIAKWQCHNTDHVYFSKYSTSTTIHSYRIYIYIYMRLQLSSIKRISFNIIPQLTLYHSTKNTNVWPINTLIRSWEAEIEKRVCFKLQFTMSVLEAKGWEQVTLQHIVSPFTVRERAMAGWHSTQTQHTEAGCSYWLNMRQMINCVWHGRR